MAAAMALMIGKITSAGARIPTARARGTAEVWLSAVGWLKKVWMPST